MIEQAVSDVRAEVEAAGRDDPEWLAGYAMCYVQARLRPWRERHRYDAGEGFTPPEHMLRDGAGLCGSMVIIWRSILHRYGMRTRQVGMKWTSEWEPYDVGHACGEAWWDEDWHFFDVMNGTVWIRDGNVLSFDAIRSELLFPVLEARYRVANAALVRYATYDAWFRNDPYAYVHAEPLEVTLVDSVGENDMMLV